MKTYQDLIAASVTEKEKTDFILSAITEHKSSPEYKIACDAIEYNKQRNVTISRYRKLLYDMSGNAVPDNWTANHKCASNFFSRFVTQQTSYLLGNGVTFGKEDTKAKLGDNFDIDLYFAAYDALVQSSVYGFFNENKINFFPFIEFKPLYDEEDGMLKSGIRFWQIDNSKPLRVTLFELDGVTEYIRRDGEDMTVITEKKPYVTRYKGTIASGYEAIGQNYPAFPIVPLYANRNKQSALVGLRENIDCYDLIKSGFANDLDDASMIYWTLENAGGMDDIDLAKFIERMKTIRAAVVDGNGGKATSHTLEVPYESRKEYLSILRNDMYEDYMALNTSILSAGNLTATQIETAYEPVDNKADEFEMCITKFIKGILAVSGIQDEPIYKRSKIRNQSEETQMILSAANVLDDETVLEKLPFLTTDEIDGIMKRKAAEEVARYANTESFTDPMEEE